MQVLHDRFNDDPGVSVLAVHFEDRGEICDHMADHDFTFRIVPDGGDVFRHLDIVRFPTLLVVGPDGNVIYNHTGRMSDEVREEIVQVALAARLD